MIDDLEWFMNRLIQGICRTCDTGRDHMIRSFLLSVIKVNGTGNPTMFKKFLRILRGISKRIQRHPILGRTRLDGLDYLLGVFIHRCHRHGIGDIEPHHRSKYDTPSALWDVISG